MYSLSGFQIFFKSRIHALFFKIFYTIIPSLSFIYTTRITKKRATAVSSTELSTGDTEIKYVPPISGEFTLLGEKTK